MLAIMELDHGLAAKSHRDAEQKVRQTAYWSLGAMILGPLVALSLGILLSISLEQTYQQCSELDRQYLCRDGRDGGTIRTCHLAASRGSQRDDGDDG